MTESEIRDELGFLNQAVGNMHNQINAIAEREATAAFAQQPVPYSNPALTRAKDDLLKRSKELIERIKSCMTS